MGTPQGPQTPSGQSRLKTSWLLAYALPGAPIAAMGLPLAVYLPAFYAEDVGLGAIAAGTVFMLTRFVDIFLDPIMGVLSDRTRTRWGRRRIWMLASVPIMCIAAWLVFMPAKGTSFETAFLSVFFLFVGWTMLTITHLAWGGELTGDYHERARITAAREAAFLVGMITVLILPIIIQQGGGDKFEQIAAMGWFVIVTLPLGVIIASLVVKEEKDRPPEPHLPLSVALGALYSNKPLRYILYADLVAGIAGGSVATLFLYVAIVGLGLGKVAYTLLLIYFGMGVICIPPLLWVTRKLGKHQTLVWHNIYNLVCMPFFFLLPAGEFWPAAILFAVLGANMAAGPFLFRAIMADVADHDHVETGQARAGVYFALLALTNKLGYSLAVGLSLYALAYLGITMKGPNTPEAIQGLFLLFIVPTVLFAGSIAYIMAHFPLDEARQRELRQILEARALGAAIGARTGRDLEGTDSDETSAGVSHPAPAPGAGKS